MPTKDSQHHRVCFVVFLLVPDLATSSLYTTFCNATQPTNIRSRALTSLGWVAKAAVLSSSPQQQQYIDFVSVHVKCLV